jgi:hypothetical protein
MTHLMKLSCLILLQATAGLLHPAYAQEDSGNESNSKDRESPQGLNDTDHHRFERWLTFFRDRNAQAYSVTGSNRIDESSYINIGGIDQWVTIRGRIVVTRFFFFSMEGLAM